MPGKKTDAPVADSALSVLNESFADPEAELEPQADPDQSTDPMVLDDYDPDHPLYEAPPAEDPDQADPDPDPDPDPEADEGPPAGANDKQRYQYWQSKHDKLSQEKASELSSYKERLDRMETQLNAPAAEGTGQAPKPAVPTTAELLAVKQKELSQIDATMPTAPAKPADYSQADAYTDPDSASFRYQRQVEEYNSNVTEYLQKRDKVKDEVFDLKVKTVEEPAQAALRQQQIIAQRKAMVDNLQKTYKLAPEEATEFVRIMSDPKSLDMENLIEYFRFQKGMASPSSSKPPRPKSGIPNRQPRTTIAAPPPPRGASGSSGNDTPDDNDDFNRSLLQGALRMM